MLMSLHPIGGSRGGVRDARPPWASKFFRFHAVFGKIWRVHAPPGGFTPPLGKILDPPLHPHTKWTPIQPHTCCLSLWTKQQVKHEMKSDKTRTCYIKKLNKITRFYYSIIIRPIITRLFIPDLCNKIDSPASTWLNFRKYAEELWDISFIRALLSRIYLFCRRQKWRKCCV